MVNYCISLFQWNTSTIASSDWSKQKKDARICNYIYVHLFRIWNRL